MAAADPVQHLSYLLLLLNVSVSLPSVAALQLRLHEQQQHQLAIEKQNRKNPLCVQPDDQQPKEQAQKQQQGRLREDVFCGFGFSRHPEQHLQLQQLVMEAGIKAGQLLAVSESSGLVLVKCRAHPALSGTGSSNCVSGLDLCLPRHNGCVVSLCRTTCSTCPVSLAAHGCSS